MFYVDSEDNYYEGKRRSDEDMEVIRKPGKDFIYRDGVWLQTLLINDIASIRAIREYIVGNSEEKTKATEYLSICEDYAKQERAKMGLSIDASVVEKS